MEGATSLGGRYLGQGGIKQSAGLVAWGGERETSILPRLRKARRKSGPYPMQPSKHTHTPTQPPGTEGLQVQAWVSIRPSLGVERAQTPDFTDAAEQGAAPWGADPQAYPHDLLIAA